MTVEEWDLRRYVSHPIKGGQATPIRFSLFLFFSDQPSKYATARTMENAL